MLECTKMAKARRDIVHLHFLHLSLNRGGRWGTTDDFFYGDSRAKYTLTGPFVHQVEHVTVEFTMEPFRPSGPSLRTIKIPAL